MCLTQLADVGGYIVLHVLIRVWLVVAVLLGHIAWHAGPGRLVIKLSWRAGVTPPLLRVQLFVASMCSCRLYLLLGLCVSANCSAIGAPFPAPRVELIP